MSERKFYIVADKAQCAEIAQVTQLSLTNATVKPTELCDIACQSQTVIKQADYSTLARADLGSLATRANKQAIELSPERFQILTYGQPLELSYLEYKLLSFLIENAGKAYSRAELLSNVWGINYYGTTRTVDVHIRRVRAKLGPELAKNLQTVRSAGYLWDMSLRA